MIYYILSFKNNSNVNIQSKLLSNHMSEYVTKIQIIKLKIPAKYRRINYTLKERGSVLIYEELFNRILNGSYA